MSSDKWDYSRAPQLGNILVTENKWSMRLCSNHNLVTWKSILVHHCRIGGGWWYVPNRYGKEMWCPACRKSAPKNLITLWTLHNFDRHTVMGNVGF